MCLPSASLRERIQQLDPAIEVADRAVIWQTGELSEADHANLAEVEFWVPGFLLSDVAALDAAISAMPRLRVIQSQSAGVDTFIGHTPDGVILCDARGVHGSATAEWALTAVLSVLREFPRFTRAQLDRRWDRTVTDELAGKRVLIIGAGDVGEQLARRVAACDASTTMVARHARAGVHATSELPELLPDADVVVVIVPKTPATVGMVDAEFLAKMADNALLVNAARGPIVDTEALLSELRSGRLRAALDVVDPEPLPADHALWTAPNLLLTPHVGGSVLGFEARAAELISAQLARFTRGEPLINVVDGDY